MKKSHILAIIMIVAALTVLFTSSKDVTQYSTFKDAQTTLNKSKISGTLAKEKMINYSPDEDPNSFSFFMKDADGQIQKVKLLQPKPQDFERSEQIVITGKMQDDLFVASDVLLKCPSKYKDEELSLRG